MNRKTLMRHAKRGWDILRHQGPQAFLNKVKLKLAENKVVYIAPANEKIVSYDELTVLSQEALASLADEQGKPVLGVQLHLYYEDLLPEFVENLNCIPCPFDLYISIRDWGEETSAHIASVEEGCRSITMMKSLVVRPTENRGRDIAPMYVLFGQEMRRYRYVLHMHSKKSLYQGSEQLGWRQYSVQSLIGSRDQAARLISLLESDDSVGVIYPERYADMAPEAYGWLSNAAKGRAFMESIGVHFQDGLFLYPAGSFFLMRNAAISQIWERKLSYGDFDEEAGQTDGTLAHVLERALGQVVSANGFHHVIVAHDRQEVHFDRDKHTFAPVFLRDAEKLFMDLSAYDVVSFDIFDTLLTRALYRPADVFGYMEALLCGGAFDGKGFDGAVLAGRGLDGKGFDGAVLAGCDWAGFQEARIAAEQDASEVHGASTNIYHIYQVLQQDLHLSDEARDALLQLELAVEASCLIPRRDVLALYEKLVAAGKTVILVSDMYLPAELLAPMLAMHGIRETGAEHGAPDGVGNQAGYVRLYISCDYGLRKDDDGLWERVLSDFPGKMLAHVGDNLQSDWQMLSDRGEKTSWLMNSRQEESISGVSLKLTQDAFKGGVKDGTKDGTKVVAVNAGDDSSVSKICDSLYRGLAVNAGLYNSPFALYPAGNPEFKDPYSLGFTVFGPLMFEYMKWLQVVTPKDAKLAFLAREGYIFQQVYALVCGTELGSASQAAGCAESAFEWGDVSQAAGCAEGLSAGLDVRKENLYLLASRRSISVAAIRSVEDIRGICRRDYDGDLRNLLRSRLGAPEDMIAKVPEKYVHFKEGMPDDDYNRAMDLIAPFFDEILAYAAVEREEYLKYFFSVIPEEDLDRTVFVDIGYAGTIQYYLSKLLDRPVTGAYMAVFHAHPRLAELGCKVLAMYGPYDADASTLSASDVSTSAVSASNASSLDTSSSDALDSGLDFLHVLEETQLFLESVLQAPYGQLLRFRDGEPVYKEEALPSGEIQALQQGLLDYAALRSKLERPFVGVDGSAGSATGGVGRPYMEFLYKKLLGGPFISEDVAKIFTVEDTYSQDSVLHYDAKAHKWKI